jgi:hypothetical protein
MTKIESGEMCLDNLELLVEEYRKLFFKDLNPDDMDSFRRWHKRIEEIGEKIIRIRSNNSQKTKSAGDEL